MGDGLLADTGQEAIACDSIVRTFGPALRLHYPRQFSEVMAGRGRLRSGCFELRYRHNQLSSPRLGLVFGKRMARRAVLRNLLKRLAREAFRDARPTLGAVDAVFRLVGQPTVGGGRIDKKMRRDWRHDFDQLLARLPK